MDISTIKFSFGALQLLVSSILIVPLPKGWKSLILQFLQTDKTIKIVQQYHFVATVLIGIHWIYSIQVSSDLQIRHIEEKQANYNAVTKRDLLLLIDKFQYEGEIYLNASLLIITIFLNRLIVLLQNYYTIKCKWEAEEEIDLSKSEDEITQQVASKQNHKKSAKLNQYHNFYETQTAGADDPQSKKNN